MSHKQQRDTGRERIAKVISELMLTWPELVLNHGKPIHLQSQSRIEWSNGNIFMP